MACRFDAGITRPCGYAISGIKTVYIANVEDVSGYTVDTNYQITDITYSASTKFFEFKPNKNSGVLDAPMTTAPEAASQFVSQTLTFIIGETSALNRATLQLLAASDVVAVAETNAGQFIMVGKDNGAFVNINQNTGTAPGNQRGYTVTITAPSEPNMCYIVEPGFAASGLTA